MIKLLRQLDYRLVVSGIVELLGVAAMCYGAYLVTPYLGYVAGGAALVWLARSSTPRESRGRFANFSWDNRVNISLGEKSEEAF